MEFCCVQMKNAVDRETVILCKKHYVRGKPEMMGDEETGYDDVTTEVEISHCPFCGLPLIPVSVIACTDYPFVQLGDIPGKPAPIRKVQVVGYDDDKYVRVRLIHAEETIKRGYLYTDATGETVVSRDVLAGLPREL